MWKPDEHLDALTSERRATLLGEIAAPGITFDPGNQAHLDSLLELFETIGARSFMGLSDPLDESQRRILQALVPAALDAIDTEALDLAGEEIAFNAPRLRLLEGDLLVALQEEIIDHLSERDRVEWVREGAAVVLGHGPELPVELEAAMAGFDSLLKDDLWRLLPLGTLRAAHAIWAEPSRRKRLWWWEKGMDLPHTALVDIAIAARVIHLFPAARAELERFVSAEESLSAQQAGKHPARVVSIRADVLARRARKMRSRDKPSAVAGASSNAPYLQLAADTGEEVVIHRFPREAPHIAVSSDGERFIVDVEHPARPSAGRTPLVHIAGCSPLALAPTEPGRFEAKLDHFAFTMTTASLTVPLVTGDVVLPLPIED